MTGRGAGSARAAQTRRATVWMWVRPVAGLLGAVGSGWWWMAAAACTVGAVVRLVPPSRVDVVGAGALLVGAAGCVLGAGLATRGARTRRWTTDPHDPVAGAAERDDLDQSRPPT